MPHEQIPFEVVYDSHGEEIYNFLYYKTFDRYAAEDLTSTVFMKAFEHYQQFQKEEGKNVKNWLYRIARNSVIDYYRTQKKDLRIDESWDIADMTDISKEVETTLALENVLASLKKLPEKERELIIMRLWQELSFKEISLILEKSEASLKMSFSRSLKSLRSSLISLLILLPFFLWQ